MVAQMPAASAAVFASLALSAAAADCNNWCGSLLPDSCQQSTAEGGCCGEDGFRVANGTCASCSPQGSAYDYMCAGCHSNSTCNGFNRVKATDATCESSGCRGGCLRSGECVYNMSQEECYAGKETWCHACSPDVFKFCYEWADCWTACSGCCSDSLGNCPGESATESFPLKITGPCAPCANRPPQCEACFPESQCSTEWNASRYHIPVQKKREVYVNPHTTKKPETTTAVASATTVASTTAQVRTATTTASSAAGASGNPEDADEAMSAGSRAASSFMLMTSLIVAPMFH